MSNTQSTALEAFLAECQARVNGALNSLLDRPLPSDRLRQAMAYASLGGGKRIRPVLVYGAARALGGSPAAADAPAGAVELIHSYSLAHDDLPAMDDDDLRRGKPSLHRAFDEATAILVGDALQSLAFEVLSTPAAGLEPARQLAMVRCLSEAAGALGMVAGQSLDFEAVGQQTADSELETLHRLKTGALIRASVLLGAMSTGNVGDSALRRLDDYAACIGLAFQVQDDILDETAETDTLGKPRGSDSARNKPTYVSIHGLDGARRLAGELIERAVASLVSFPDDADRLRELATYIVNRSH